jgi:hypothetical protein
MITEHTSSANRYVASFRTGRMNSRRPGEAMMDAS